MRLVLIEAHSRKRQRTQRGRNRPRQRHRNTRPLGSMLPQMTWGRAQHHAGSDAERPVARIHRQIGQCPPIPHYGQ